MKSPTASELIANGNERRSMEASRALARFVSLSDIVWVCPRTIISSRPDAIARSIGESSSNWPSTSEVASSESVKMSGMAPRAPSEASNTSAFGPPAPEIPTTRSVRPSSRSIAPATMAVTRPGNSTCMGALRLPRPSPGKKKSVLLALAAVTMS